VTETKRPRVVALGGGHGLQATLAALREITPDVTAVVTVADDGGSSGRCAASWAYCHRVTCARPWWPSPGPPRT